MAHVRTRRPRPACQTLTAGGGGPAASEAWARLNYSIQMVNAAAGTHILGLVCCWQTPGSGLCTAPRHALDELLDRHAAAIGSTYISKTPRTADSMGPFSILTPCLRQLPVPPAHMLPLGSSLGWCAAVPSRRLVTWRECQSDYS